MEFSWQVSIDASHEPADRREHAACALSVAAEHHATRVGGLLDGRGPSIVAPAQSI